MNIDIAKKLLEDYFKGKDKNIPSIIENLFTKDAIVTFDIDSDAISFPSKIQGAKNISNIMFDDFHEKFEDVMSYYLINDNLIVTDNKIFGLQWLVTMKEKETGLFRVGTGFYDWTFSEKDRLPLDWGVEALHIHIEFMSVFHDSNKCWLSELQQTLSFPWVTYAQAIASLKKDERLKSIVNYISAEQDVSTQDYFFSSGKNHQHKEAGVLL